MKAADRISWMLYVSRRFARVDSRGRSAVTSALASLGICLGVATLIVILSVMNGLQQSSIEALVEVSSGHVRCEVPDGILAEFKEFCFGRAEVLSAVEFMDAQSLVSGSGGRQESALVRAVPRTMLCDDAGFASQLKIVAGDFDFGGNGIVLGNLLARNLGVTEGDFVTLLALSGGSDVDLVDDTRRFLVTGVFTTGFNEINRSFAFVSLEDGRRYFGEKKESSLFLKLRNSSRDGELISLLQKEFPGARCGSWREFNRAFFGALRVEKNMLLILLLLIFLVVGINIFNGMRRLVFERREEIAVLSSLGGPSGAVQGIFVMQGFLTGAKGALPGLLAGLALSVNMGAVFRLTAKAMYLAEYFSAMLLNPAMASFVRENRAFIIYSQIPARVHPAEALCVTLFGLLSALLASWAASRGVLRLSVSEVLHEQ